MVTFRFSEVMKDNFEISESDVLEFTLAPSSNNGVCLDNFRNFLIDFILYAGFTSSYSN
jgi:hypothetical protein